MEKSRSEIDAAKSQALFGLIRKRHAGPLRRALVVGCGSGREAGILGRTFHAETIGIDIGAEFVFDHEASRPAKLMLMDAQALEFEDSFFDLVYSFHALEHIPDPRRALSEMRRVLRVGGTFCLGTPNRARLIGYIGSSAPPHLKCLWNLKDLSYRLKGKWSNEEGAHAGFYADELRGLCREHFGEAEEITDQYYQTLYARRRNLVEWVTTTKLKYRILPCIYVAGIRTAGSVCA